MYFAYIEKVSPLRKKEKPSDIAPKLYKLCKEALHRMPFVAPWNDYKFYETHITYTKPLENPIPALAPPTPSPSTPLSAVISSQRLEEAKRGELMCKELFQKLIDRKFAVEKRVQKNYFWQNSQKNNAKLAALQAIETACTTGKETTEILKLIKEKHAILTQSTSALPLFFPKPVTTKTILAPYQSIIQTP